MTRIILKSSLATGVTLAVFLFTVHFFNLKPGKEAHAPLHLIVPTQAVTPQTVDFDERAITLLPGNPMLRLNVGTSASSGQVNAGTTTSETYRANSWQFFNYTIGDANDFVFSRVSWGYFDDSDTFRGKAGSTGPNLVLGLHGAAGKQLKIKAWDASFHTKEFWVRLTGNWQNYKLNLSGLDTEHIAMIDFVADQMMTGSSGSVGIVARGLAYTWMASGIAYDQSSLSTLPENPTINSGHGTTTSSDNATITTTQVSSTTYSTASDVPDKGDFTYSGIGWGYFSNATTFVGTGVTLGNSVTLALSGTPDRVLQVEFVSSANFETKKVFNVVLSAKPRNYTFDITGCEPLGLINFVQDQTGETHYTVETKGLDYVSALISVSSNCLEGDDRFSQKYLFQDRRTVWHAEVQPKYPQWVEITFPEPTLLTHLGLRSQDDSPNGKEHIRGPKDFIFQGSNQPAAFLGLSKNRKWVDLIEVKDNIYTKGEEWKDWLFENKTPYLHYRIYIKAGGDSQYLTIRQIRMDNATRIPAHVAETVAPVRPAVTAPVEATKSFTVKPLVTVHSIPQVSLDSPKFDPVNLRERYNKVLQRAGIKGKEEAMEFSLVFWENKRKAYSS